MMLLAACASSLQPPTAMPTPTLGPSPVPSATPSTRPPAGAPATSLPSTHEPAVEQARADLARRLNIAVDQVTVVSVTESGQPLPAADCQPIEAQASAPANVMGQDITLNAGGRTFVYRVQGGRVLVCEGTTSASSWPPQAETAVRAAIDDLASKRGLAPESVQVVSVTAEEWQDTSLGCPQPGMHYAQIIVQGYGIVLTAGGQQVEYHSDRHGHVVTCR